MSAVWGALLAAGALLVVAPWLWPRRERVARDGVDADRRNWLDHKLARAGFSRIPSAVFVVVSCLVALLSAAVAQIIFGVAVLSLCAGIAGALAPYLAVNWRENRRRITRSVLWPDVIDHLISGVRSGIALPDAMVSLARSGPEPLRAQFDEFARDYRATASFSGSLDRFKDAAADPIADRIAETLRMAREVGGSNLTTVLRALSAHLREDLAVRSEVAARQSWVRNAAKLGVAAPWVILVLLATRPEASAAYNSPGGVVVIAVGAGVSIVAYKVMVAIGRLPREKRWFR